MGRTNWIEFTGYFASMLILISFLTNSIVKLRWINMVGSFIFGIYGFLISSVPTGVMNTIIGTVNIYYLIKIYNSKAYFTILEINKEDQYLTHFLKFYKSEIERYFPKFDFTIEKNDLIFSVLSDTETACIFMGERMDKESLLIKLDFAVPEFRNCKIGRFIYGQEKLFKDLSYKRFLAYSYNSDNTKYLKKMGFVEVPSKEGLFSKDIGTKL